MAAVLLGPCRCGHGAVLHQLGREGGQTVRKACSASVCGCRVYRSPAALRRVGQCPTCGAPREVS